MLIDIHLKAVELPFAKHISQWLTSQKSLDTFLHSPADLFGSIGFPIRQNGLLTSSGNMAQQTSGHHTGNLRIFMGNELSAGIQIKL